MQKHWIVWFSLCKYRFKNCFLFLVLAKMWQPAQKEKENDLSHVVWCLSSTASDADLLIPPDSAVLKVRPLYVNAHELPSSKQSTGLTFNYKINMDFLINTHSVCVYRNGALKSPLTLTELRPFFLKVYI